jgi:hypothetical protein
LALSVMDRLAAKIWSEVERTFAMRSAGKLRRSRTIASVTSRAQKVSTVVKAAVCLAKKCCDADARIDAAFDMLRLPSSSMS